MFFFTLEVIGLEGNDGKLDLGKYGMYDIAHNLHEEEVKVKTVIDRAVTLGLFELTDSSSCLFCPALVNGYSDEWSNRKRKQHLLEVLEASGELGDKTTLSYVESQMGRYVARIKDVLEYLNVKSSKQYRWQSKDNQLLISARLKDGYTVEDLKKIVDNMCDKWMGDEKMEQYLRPITLFARSKVEGYLNAKTNSWDRFKG